MIFAPAQKLSSINSHVDIKAKLTPSAGQVESDGVTALRANTSEFMSFGHSIPMYSHFKTNFTALKRLFHADAHANHVELFPAASRWMITCLAAVGCFHDLLIIIEESACGWFASTMSICSSSISVCRKERKTVVDLYLPKKQPTFCISPRNMMSVSERTLIFYQKGRSLATFLKGIVYVVKHWKRLLLFLYCIYLLCYKFTSFVNVFPRK